MDADVSGTPDCRPAPARAYLQMVSGGNNGRRRRVAAIKGTPQDAVISPLLANIYLHYVLDLWARQWRQRHARGDVIVVRYADDSVVVSGQNRRLSSSWSNCGNGWPGSVYRSTLRRHG